MQTQDRGIVADAMDGLINVKLETLEKSRRKKIINDTFQQIKDPDSDLIANGAKLNTEHPNDLDYLYMMSYISQEKIHKLDNLDNLDKFGNAVRKKIVKKNDHINKFIKE